MRGSGDSEGYLYDEYEKQEQEDCCDVISWISRQVWCTGNVGKFCRMFSYSILHTSNVLWASHILLSNFL